MKIGLYFGTFNPIHIGHLAIASYMAEFTELDQVWFVISPHNPLKEKSSLLKDTHRLAMLRLALENFHKKLKVSTIELKLPQPSYTIHTLLHLKEKYPSHTFSIIMGSDNLHSLPKWKNYEQIIAQVDIYVYPRESAYEGPFVNHPKVHFTNAPLMEISSSFIRLGISAKKDMRGFLPEAIHTYIQEMHFYE